MSGDDTPLREYSSRRDFRRTPEPDGDGHRSSDDAPVFVFQKHDASSLHYDFRLESDGVLLSWAVPKGPSTDPRERRLAIRTEDHPLEYADFEGVIPEEEYGGGTVMVWDRGRYENAKVADAVGDKARPSIARQVEDGHVVVRLHGEKLRGVYALTRIDQRKGRWLLVKTDDDEADARRSPTSTENRSVRSGRTMEEIEAAESDDGGEGSS